MFPLTLSWLLGEAQGAAHPQLGERSAIPMGKSGCAEELDPWRNGRVDIPKHKIPGIPLDLRPRGGGNPGVEELDGQTGIILELGARWGIRGVFQRLEKWEFQELVEGLKDAQGIPGLGIPGPVSPTGLPVSGAESCLDWESSQRKSINSISTFIKEFLVS